MCAKIRITLTNLPKVKEDVRVLRVRHDSEGSEAEEKHRLIVSLLQPREHKQSSREAAELAELRVKARMQAELLEKAEAQAARVRSLDAQAEHSRSQLDQAIRQTEEIRAQLEQMRARARALETELEAKDAKLQAAEASLAGALSSTSQHAARDAEWRKSLKLKEAQWAEKEKAYLAREAQLRDEFQERGDCSLPRGRVPQP